MQDAIAAQRILDWLAGLSLPLGVGVWRLMIVPGLFREHDRAPASLFGDLAEEPKEWRTIAKLGLGIMVTIVGLFFILGAGGDILALCRLNRSFCALTVYLSLTLITMSAFALLIRARANSYIDLTSATKETVIGVTYERRVKTALSLIGMSWLVAFASAIFLLWRLSLART